MLNKDNILTNREKEVLKLVKNGLTNEEIAGVLIISVNTVKYHVKNILSKYCIHDRKKLIVETNKNNY